MPQKPPCRCFGGLTEVFGGFRPPIRPTITGTNAADAEAKTKSLSTPQIIQKREIPNNDAPKIIEKDGVKPILDSLQLKQRSKRKPLLGGEEARPS
jgi:hypothetical protein